MGVEPKILYEPLFNLLEKFRTQVPFGSIG